MAKDPDSPLSFKTMQIASIDYPYTIELADVDGDGDLDFVVGSVYGGDLKWFENDGSSVPRFSQHDVVSDAGWVYGASVADMDGDGDMDIISSGPGSLTWYENSGGENPEFTPVRLANINSGREIFLKDLDGDGDLDIIGTDNSSDSVTWYKNDGSADPSFAAVPIDTNANGAQDVHVEDIDGDGDLDIVVASQDSDSIDWYENSGGANPTWKKTVITDELDAANGVFMADMDGDGDMDILSASQDDSRIAWYENDGNPDPSFTAIDIAKDECCGRNPRDPVTGQDLPASVGQALDVRAADFDGDGDLDVITSNASGDFHVYRNDGNDSPSFSQEVFAEGENPYSRAIEMDHGDIDGDGDLDVISFSAEADVIFWHANE